MKEILQKRLVELQQEFEAGKEAQRDLESKQVHLQETMLRISGAIQVLEELLREEAPEMISAAENGNGAQVEEPVAVYGRVVGRHN